MSEIDIPKLELLMARLYDELTRAYATYGPVASVHEGYALILEELDELWDEVRKKDAERDPADMRVEAVQIAAIALRFALDLT